MKNLKHVLTLLLFSYCAFAASALAEITYYINDLSGSPVVAMDEAGQVIWRESYRPYGERLKNEIGSQENKTWFTSRHQDTDTGLVYMGARFYDPMIGRFVSTDPQRFSEKDIHSFNRYAYGNNNPVRYYDRNGMWVEDAVLAVPGLALGAYSLGQNLKQGNWGSALVDFGGIVADGIALAIPGVPGVAGLSIAATRAGAGAGAKGGETAAELILNAERIGSGLKADTSHRSASFLSKEQLEAGKTFALRGGDGVERTLLQTPGGLNGKNGIYEYIYDAAGKVSHQRFIESGTITGLPNQLVP